MFGIDFLDDLVSKIGVPLVSKGIKALTGIDIEAKELTPEDKQKIVDSQIEIMKIDFQKIQEDNRAKEFVVIQDNQNTANARENNAKIEDSQNASRLAKITPYVLDFIAVLAVLFLGTLLFFVDIPKDNIQILNIMFGVFLGVLQTIYNYYRGSSKSSVDKQEIINKLNTVK